MTDLTKYFIDLSKCTEEEVREIREIIFHSNFPVASVTRHVLEYMIVRKFNGTPYLLINDLDHWKLDRTDMNKTELTYPEFIKLFENGSLSLQTKLEMFYDFLYERGVAKQLGVGIDTIVKHFIDEKLLSNDR